MVRDYTTALYEPAAAAASRMHTEDGAAAKALAAWKRHVLAHWDAVAVTKVSADDASSDDATRPRSRAAGAEGNRQDAHHSVSASVRLGELTAADVLVQVVHGPLDLDGGFASSTAAPLARAEQLADGSLRYAGSYVPTAAGMYGCTVRVLPNHSDLTTPMELGRIAWA